MTVLRLRQALKTPFTYITLVAIVTMTLVPLLWGVASSLRKDSELFKYATPFSSKTMIPQEPTFDAYVRLFTEFDFQRPIMNTLVVSVLTIIFGCLVNSVAAFAFAVFDFRFKKTIYAVVLVSFMIPFEAIALPLYTVADGLNMIDTRAGMIVPSVADGLVLFLFTQFFRELPKEMFEAARMDGAGWPTIFVRVVAPLSVPVFITAGLMIFMGQWNSYLWPLLVARSDDVQVIQTALAQFSAERATLWSVLYAGSMVSALIPLVFFLPLQKYFVQGITSSGIKG